MKTNFQKLAENAIQFTSTIIGKFGPRLAGDKITLQASEYIHNEFKKSCSNTFIEKFDVHPKAFLSGIRFISTGYLLAVIFIWLNLPIVSTGCIVAGFVIYFLEVMAYKEVVDFLFPKKIAQNIIGHIEPQNKPKRQIIISGHHDSAFVFNFFKKHSKLFPLRMIAGWISFFLFLGFCFVVSIFQVFFPPSIGSDTLLITGVKIVFTLFSIHYFQLWFFLGKKGTPGAGDNMIATAVVNEIGKMFSQKNKCILKDTRLILASFDAEEEGLRGARAYCKRHFKQLHDIPTQIINLECLYRLKELTCLTSDLNCFVPLSIELAESVKHVAKKSDVDIRLHGIPFFAGGTDAAEFAKINIPAVTLVAMTPETHLEVYHTEDDNIDAIEEKLIEKVIKILHDYIIQFGN